jgi:hypothetical protein
MLCSVTQMPARLADSSLMAMVSASRAGFSCVSWIASSPQRLHLTSLEPALHYELVLFSPGVFLCKSAFLSPSKRGPSNSVWPGARARAVRPSSMYEVGSNVRLTYTFIPQSLRIALGPACRTCWRHKQLLNAARKAAFASYEECATCTAQVAPRAPPQRRKLI